MQPFLMSGCLLLKTLTCTAVSFIHFRAARTICTTCRLAAGPGRAGTKTTLLGSNGSKYVGEVLAGRPHGMGQYWAPVSKQCQQGGYMTDRSWDYLGWQIAMLFTQTS